MGNLASVDDSSQTNLWKLVALAKHLLDEPVTERNFQTGKLTSIPCSGTNREALYRCHVPLSPPCLWMCWPTGSSLWLLFPVKLWTCMWTINFSVEILVLGMVCHNKARYRQHNFNFLVKMTQPLPYDLFIHWCHFQALDHSHRMSCNSLLCAYKVDGAQINTLKSFTISTYWLCECPPS